MTELVKPISHFSNLPREMIVEIMNFLDPYEIEYDIFYPYIESHRYRRTAEHNVYTNVDIRISYVYPNSKLAVNLYPRTDILYIMEPDDYNRVTTLRTVTSIAASLFVNLIHLDISYSNSSYIPELAQLRSINCSYTNVSELPESLPNLETLIAANSSITYLSPSYKKMRHLDIYETFISELPIEYTQLERLCCSYTLVFEIPDTYTKLTYLDCAFSIVNKIPDTLTNLRTLKSK